MKEQLQIATILSTLPGRGAGNSNSWEHIQDGNFISALKVAKCYFSMLVYT